MLVTCASPPPPHTWVPGWSNQHSSHSDGQPASSHNSPVLYIYPIIAPNKSVYTEPLSITVPVLFSTCTVLVGTVVSLPIPAPPQTPLHASSILPVFSPSPFLKVHVMTVHLTLNVMCRDKKFPLMYIVCRKKGLVVNTYPPLLISLLQDISKRNKCTLQGDRTFGPLHTKELGR